MKALLSRLAARPLLLAELLVASLLVNLLGLGSTIFVMLVLNRYVPYGIDATLATLAVGVTLAALLEFGFREARHRLASAALAPLDSGRGEAAFSALVHARAPVLERVPAAIRQEAVRGIDAIERAYTPANLAGLLDVPFSLVTLVALALLSPPLSLVAAASMAAALGLTLVGERAARGRVRAAMEAEAAAGGLLVSAASATDTVRAFNAAGRLAQRWADLRLRLVRARAALLAEQALVGGLTQALATLQAVAVITIGAVLCVRGQLSTGALIGANILAARALGPMMRLAQLIEPLAKADQAARRLAEFAHLPREQASGMALKDFSGRLELADLAFAYPGAASPLAEHLSLRLEPGTVLVVTGPNGSGKTTFLRLLLGLVDPLRGQVLADGVDLRQLSTEWWRSRIAYLPQEADFFDGTVAENIVVANPALGEEAISALAGAAGLRAWLDTSEHGFDTRITEGGRHLPPGVRRRLALARALAVEGPMALLDEPADSMDAQGRAAVFAALARFAQEGRTVVVCANDPAVVRGANLMLDLGVKPVPRLLTPQPALAPAAVQAVHHA